MHTPSLHAALGPQGEGLHKSWGTFGCSTIILCVYIDKEKSYNVCIMYVFLYKLFMYKLFILYFMRK